MAILDPTAFRLSPHFLLSDLMGCSSVYTRGFRNYLDKQPGIDPRIANGQALCEQALEPLLAIVGSFSVSYGFICPELSRHIVTYQDWRKPSHHRWDLGAAVDICPHHYVLQSTSKDASAETGAPIIFALEHMQDLPLSRLITYSESPFICVAVSAEEVEQNVARMAWYENRYGGKKGAKPDFIKYSSAATRAKALAALTDQGLKTKWTGHGYPTYHGGGRKQLHHIRVSKYTMVTDWLFDEMCVREGVKNQPSLDKPEVLEAFQLAGAAYDAILKHTGIPRLSIVSAYTSHLSDAWIDGRDWRTGPVTFEVVPPEYLGVDGLRKAIMESDLMWPCVFGKMDMVDDGDRMQITVQRGTDFEKETKKTSR